MAIPGFGPGLDVKKKGVKMLLVASHRDTAETRCLHEGPAVTRTDAACALRQSMCVSTWPLPCGVTPPAGQQQPPNNNRRQNTQAASGVPKGGNRVKKEATAKKAAEQIIFKPQGKGPCKRKPKTIAEQQQLTNE